VRHRANWLGPLIVVLLFAAMILLLIWLTWGVSDSRKRPFGKAADSGFRLQKDVSVSRLIRLARMGGVK
jgi:hypothetical protein